MGEKDDIAYAAVYLCSSAAKYINGELMVVDGGTWMAKPEIVDRKFYEKHIRRSKL
jgi:peroxisomal 2,4-dienoyl-CoA reductase